MIAKRFKHHSQESAAKFLLVLFSLIVGIVASEFAKCCGWADNLFQSWFQHHHYLPLILCPCGFALLYILTTLICKEAKGSGIPQTIVALHTEDNAIRNNILHWKVIIAKFLLTIGAFLCGAAIGREGPTVLISAALMYHLCHTNIPRFHINIMRRGLIMAGGAAGIAAAFCTPIAGIMFAIEELSKTFESRLTKLLTLSIIICGFVSIYLLKKPQYFPNTAGTLNWQDAVAVFVCSLVCGIMGGLFTRLLIISVKKLSKLTFKLRIYCAVLFGFIIALLGIIMHGTTFGSSYDEVTKLLLGGGTANAGVFGIVKIVSIFITYLSSFSGGILAPTLAAGGGVGYMFHLFFTHTSQSSLVIIGMISYFTGVVRSPLTCFVIVLEMTGRYDLCLPLMAATFIADMTSARISPKPIYEALAEMLEKEFTSR